MFHEFLSEFVGYVVDTMLYICREYEHCYELERSTLMYTLKLAHEIQLNCCILAHSKLKLNSTLTVLHTICPYRSFSNEHQQYTNGGRQQTYVSVCLFCQLDTFALIMNVMSIA